MSRLQYNSAIILKLKELIYKYPDLRFGQLLVNSEVLKLKEVLLDGQRETALFIEDCFNEESEITWKRMCDNKMCFPKEE